MAIWEQLLRHKETPPTLCYLLVLDQKYKLPKPLHVIYTDFLQRKEFII